MVGKTHIAAGPPGWSEAEVFLEGWIDALRALPYVHSVEGSVDYDSESDDSPEFTISFALEAQTEADGERIADGAIFKAGLNGGMDRIATPANEVGWMGSTEVRPEGYGLGS